MGDTAEGLSARLSKYISTVRFGDLPAPAVGSAELSLLDAVGVSLAASRLGEGCAAFAELVIGEGGRADSTVLGFGVRVPAASAALANGAMAHSLDFEDSADDAPVHPNAQVIPAVLALAEQLDVDGERLVTAIAVGCDLTIRLGRAVGTQLSDNGWYPPPILGALGATAACANLVQLDSRQTLDALSLAVSQATASGAIKYNPQSIIRGVRDSFASHAAVRSVQLAQRGIRGFDAPLEGRGGFLASYASADYDRDALLAGLGETFAGSTVSYKPWPSCRGTHAFIEAILELRPRLDLDHIESVELIGGPVVRMLAEPRHAKQAPTTAIDAKFSLMFTVATALVDGAVTLDSFSAEALSRPDVLAMARLIEFVPDESMTSAADMTAGRTVVKMTDGATFSYDVSTPRGNPASPLSREEIRAKFVACAGESVNPLDGGTALHVADALLDVHAQPSLRAFLGELFGVRPSR